METINVPFLTESTPGAAPRVFDTLAENLETLRDRTSIVFAILMGWIMARFTCMYGQLTAMALGICLCLKGCCGFLVKYRGFLFDLFSIVVDALMICLEGLSETGSNLVHNYSNDVRIGLLALLAIYIFVFVDSYKTLKALHTSKDLAEYYLAAYEWGTNLVQLVTIAAFLLTLTFPEHVPETLPKYTLPAFSVVFSGICAFYRLRLGTQATVAEEDA